MLDFIYNVIIFSLKRIRCKWCWFDIKYLDMILVNKMILIFVGWDREGDGDLGEVIEGY